MDDQVPLSFDTQAIDADLAVLQANKQRWADLPVSRKIDLLLDLRQRVDEHAQAWVDAAVAGKQIDPASPWVGEEWVSGVWAFQGAINGTLKTLEAIAAGQKPSLPGVKTRPNGQVIAKVFPTDAFDALLMSGSTAEVWMEPGVTEQSLPSTIATFYDEPNPVGKVSLVLGAGNIASIPALDVLHKLYNEGEICLLKLNPVNSYLKPVFEDIFATFMDEGFMRFADGGGDVGAYLTSHDLVDTIHITGSAKTHDVIVFGPGEEGQARKAMNDPVLTKPISSELGGVGPLVVVPGPWSESDIKFQAENIVTTKLHNGGFNCVATQLLVLPAEWEHTDALLAEVRRLLKDIPPRTAYYPGADGRRDASIEAHADSAELLGQATPRALLTGLNPYDGEAYAFNQEFFCASLAQTSLSGSTPAEFLRNAVDFCNNQVAGTLGMTILIHPKTQKELGDTFDQALADLRYGGIGVNSWVGGTYLLTTCSWGAFPGHTLNDVQSGIGTVHNTFMFDRPQKAIVRSPFYEFPRGWLHGDFNMAPKPLWFVTNANAHRTAEKVARFAGNPGWGHIPGIFVEALKGALPAPGPSDQAPSGRPDGDASAGRRNLAIGAAVGAAVAMILLYLGLRKKTQKER